MELEKISRRSFMKKTTVLTVGVASMSLFSGLVNATEGGYYYSDCVMPCAGFFFTDQQTYKFERPKEDDPFEIETVYYTKGYCKCAMGHEVRPAWKKTVYNSQAPTEAPEGPEHPNTGHNFHTGEVFEWPE